MGISGFPVRGGIDIRGKTITMTQLETQSTTLVTVKEVASGSGYFDFNLQGWYDDTTIGTINAKITVDGSVLLNDVAVMDMHNRTSAGGFKMDKMPYVSSYKVEIKVVGVTNTIGVVTDYAA